MRPQRRHLLVIRQQRRYQPRRRVLSHKTCCSNWNISLQLLQFLRQLPHRRPQREESCGADDSCRAPLHGRHFLWECRCRLILRASQSLPQRQLRKYRRVSSCHFQSVRSFRRSEDPIRPSNRPFSPGRAASTGSEPADMPRQLLSIFKFLRFPLSHLSDRGVREPTT